MFTDWDEMRAMPDPNSKADFYQKKVDHLMSSCFPRVTMRRKSSDPPWINTSIRRRLRQRRAVYRREGRSMKWKRLKKVVEDMVDRRRKVYEGSQKLVLLADDADRHFFKNCKNYQSKELSLIHI